MAYFAPSGDRTIIAGWLTDSAFTQSVAEHPHNDPVAGYTIAVVPSELADQVGVEREVQLTDDGLTYDADLLDITSTSALVHVDAQEIVDAASTLIRAAHAAGNDLDWIDHADDLFDLIEVIADNAARYSLTLRAAVELLPTNIGPSDHALVESLLSLATTSTPPA
jgi:hypothetical protein